MWAHVFGTNKTPGWAIRTSQELIRDSGSLLTWIESVCVCAFVCVCVCEQECNPQHPFHPSWLKLGVVVFSACMVFLCKPLDVHSIDWKSQPLLWDPVRSPNQWKTPEGADWAQKKGLFKMWIEHVRPKLLCLSLAPRGRRSLIFICT